MSSKRRKVTPEEIARRCHTSARIEAPHQITNIVNAHGVKTYARITGPTLPRPPPAPTAAVPSLPEAEMEYEEVEEELTDEDFGKLSETQVSLVCH